MVAYLLNSWSLTMNNNTGKNYQEHLIHVLNAEFTTPVRQEHAIHFRCLKEFVKMADKMTGNPTFDLQRPWLHT